MPKIHMMQNNDQNFPSIDLLQKLLDVNAAILTDKTKHLRILEKIMENPYIVADEFLDDTITSCENKRKKSQKDRSEFEYWLTQNPSDEYKNILEKNIVCIDKIDKIHQQELFLSENYKRYTGVKTMISALHGGHIASSLPTFTIEHLKRLNTFFEKHNLRTSVIDIHGFFTAIISIPHATSPVKWMDHLRITECDTESNDEIFEVCEALMILYTDIVKNMRDATFNVERFFEQVGHKENVLLAKQRWAFWYMDGVFLEGTEWEMDEQFTSLFLLISALGNKGEILEKRLGAERAEFLKSEGEKNLSDIAMKIYSDSHGKSKTELSENPMCPSQKKIKQNRNAPCQCSSGKKFKHCCLN